MAPNSARLFARTALFLAVEPRTFVRGHPNQKTKALKPGWSSRDLAHCLEDSVHPAPLLPSAGVEHPGADRSIDQNPPQERVSACSSKEELDRRLDRALEETFPASDPVSIVCN